jgi:hypothetical protein
MNAFLFSVTTTIVFFVVALLTARWFRRAGWLAVVAPFGAVLAMALGSTLLFMQALATFVLAIVVLIGGGRSLRAAAWVLGIATAASYAFLVLNVGPRIFDLIAEHDELQAMYPVVSLDERLAYENAFQAVAGPSTPANRKAPLSETVDRALSDREKRDRWTMRQGQLQRLHDQMSDRFIAAEGFGPMRLSGIGEVRLPPLPTLSLDEDGISATESAYIGRAEPTTYAPARFMRMHEESQRDFLDRNRMGYVENRRRVIGFEPHAFTRVPVPPASDRWYGDSDDPDPDWTVVRAELLSLLKHDPPAAYVSEHLPRMDELRDAPTRPLIAFEQAALERLRTEHDVVAEQQTNVIRMVGSLRAGNDCLICHRGARGDLLGALSYELRRTRSRPAPAKKHDEPLSADERIGGR